MNDKLNFRRINEIEKKIITNSYSNISIDFPKIIENFKTCLYVSIDKSKIINKFPKIYLLPESLLKLLKTLDNNKIISAGLYFGFIKKGNFYLSLEGVEFLYNNNLLTSFKKIQVNDKGEKSILYGNNILKNMIYSISDILNENDLLLVVNRNEEIIAIALSKTNSQNTQRIHPDEMIATILTDKGIYLREKQ